MTRRHVFVAVWMHRRILCLVRPGCMLCWCAPYLLVCVVLLFALSSITIRTVSALLIGYFYSSFQIRCFSIAVVLLLCCC